MLKLKAEEFWALLVNVEGARSGRFFLRRKEMHGLRHVVAAAVARAYHYRSRKVARIVAPPAVHHAWRTSGLGWRQRLSAPMEVSRGLLLHPDLLVIDELPSHAYHGKLMAGLDKAVEASKKPNGPVILFVLGEDPPPKLLAAWFSQSNFEEIEIASDHD